MNKNFAMNGGGGGGGGEREKGSITGVGFMRN